MVSGGVFDIGLEGFLGLEINLEVIATSTTKPYEHSAKHQSLH